MDDVHFLVLPTVSRLVDDVNMLAADPGGAYHHGDLRNALIAAGVELAREGGPGAVLLRAATRMAGVSPNAAYRHFANQEDLLAAVAEECTSRLGQLMIDRANEVRARGPVKRAQARFEAIGRAYVEFALTERGWFRTAFASAEPHGRDGDGTLVLPTREEGVPTTNPFLVLAERLDELVEVGVLPARHRPGAEFFAWSSVHGLASLLVTGPLRHLPDAAVQRAIDAVLTAVPRGLA